MPIVSCLVPGDAPMPAPDEIVRSWAEATGIDSSEMTVNLVPAVQGGKRYAAIALLYLPSLWSEDDVVILGEGLAVALAAALGVELPAIQVVTTVVPSGSVVEAGKVIRWS